MKYKGILIAILTLALVLTGCSSSAPAQKEWVEITYATNVEDGLQLITLQEPLLEKLGIRFVQVPMEEGDPQEALDEWIKEDKLPDLLLIQDLDVITIRQWAEQGELKTLPPKSLSSRKSLWEHGAAWSELLTVQGQWSAVPMESWNPQASASQTLIYCRKDWAKNLGVEDLSHITWSDFIKLAQGYAHGDPDYNGVADTWGITYAGPGLGPLAEVFYGAFGVEDWVQEKGVWVPGWSSGAAKEATSWLVQLRRQGVLDPEGAEHTREESLELFCKGYAGMILWDDPTTLEQAWQQVQATRENPKAILDTVTVLALPENPYGTLAMTGDTDSAPMALFGSGISDVKLNLLLSLMEEVGAMAWQQPQAPADDASFPQKSVYRRRMYYRPHQRTVPSRTLALGNEQLARDNRQQRQLAKEALAELIASPDDFESLWNQWTAQVDALCGQWKDAVQS